MNYTIQDLVAITGGKLTVASWKKEVSISGNKKGGKKTLQSQLRARDDESAVNVNFAKRVISGVATDSRGPACTSDKVFIALKGPHHDGHDYIPEAINKGVRVFLVSHTDFTYNPIAGEEVVFIQSPDTLEALQKLATHHRSALRIPVTAITGSNGKTIVKEWIYHILSKKYRVYRSPGSYNSQVGVPLAILGIQPEHEMAIIEAGISRPGEMEKLERIIRPDVGIFTHIGPAHQANFDSMEQKVREKMTLFKNAGKILYCTDQHLVADTIKNMLQEGTFKKKPDLIYWGKKTDNNLRIQDMVIGNNHTTVHFLWKKKKYIWDIPFHDSASVENALHAGLFALQNGLKPEETRQEIAHLRPVEMRLEFKKGIRNSLIINDSYNLDLDSLENALGTLSAQIEFEKKILVLSDIPETGITGNKLYRQVSDIIRRFDPVWMIGIGTDISRYADFFSEKSRFYNHTAEFLDQLKEEEFAHAAILLKGARAFRFEEIDHRLQQKHHSTVLEINLDAVTHNLSFYRQKLQPKTKVMGMVKAFSYGSGSAEIAALLEHHRIDYLGVAYADEGVELRRQGISLPVMVMSPEPASFATMIRHDLEPEIYSFRQLDAFYEEYVSLPDAPPKMGIHIKTDTGMHRLGFDSDQAEELARAINKMHGLQVKSVFSHLAASDSPEQRDFTRKQVRLYDKFCSALQTGGVDGFLMHICNTAGILTCPEAHYDMVRLGLGLYGIDITGKHSGELENALTFRTMIAQIKELAAGETVGYDRAGKIECPSRIATLTAGYADGIRMQLSKGKGYVLIHGKNAPFVGKICMDMSMVDVTGIPEAREGDTAIVFGEKPAIMEVAKLAGTIPYDFLAGIPGRVKRVYFKKR